MKANDTKITKIIAGGLTNNEADQKLVQLKQAVAIALRECEMKAYAFRVAQEDVLRKEAEQSQVRDLFEKYQRGTQSCQSRQDAQTQYKKKLEEQINDLDVKHDDASDAKQHGAAKATSAIDVTKSLTDRVGKSSDIETIRLLRYELAEVERCLSIICNELKTITKNQKFYEAQLLSIVLELEAEKVGLYAVRASAEQSLDVVKAAYIRAVAECNRWVDQINGVWAKLGDVRTEKRSLQEAITSVTSAEKSVKGRLMTATKALTEAKTDQAKAAATAELVDCQKQLSDLEAQLEEKQVALAACEEQLSSGPSVQSDRVSTEEVSADVKAPKVSVPTPPEIDEQAVYIPKPVDVPSKVITASGKDSSAEGDRVQQDDNEQTSTNWSKSDANNHVTVGTTGSSSVDVLSSSERCAYNERCERLMVLDAQHRRESQERQSQMFMMMMHAFANRHGHSAFPLPPFCPPPSNDQCP